jgi:hypothetical protein
MKEATKRPKTQFQFLILVPSFQNPNKKRICIHSRSTRSQTKKCRISLPESTAIRNRFTAEWEDIRIQIWGRNSNTLSCFRKLKLRMTSGKYCTKEKRIQRLLTKLVSYLNLIILGMWIRFFVIVAIRNGAQKTTQMMMKKYRLIELKREIR